MWTRLATRFIGAITGRTVASPADAMTVPLAVWLRATWLGWILGVPLILVLALAGEAVGIGGAQVLV